MTDSSRELRDLPRLFLAGVICNWLGVGLLAWRPRQMIGAAILLSIGTVMMFVAAHGARSKGDRAKGVDRDDGSTGHR